MKKILFAVIALFSLSGCSFNRPNVPDEPIMQVAGKTFYKEGYVSVLVYFKFADDSVYYRYINSLDTGTYVQTKDIITFKLNKELTDLHAMVKEDMIIYEGSFYVQKKPF